jgi:hypothetical protein
MDIVTLALLYFFGALFAGLALGFVVGKLTRFELGLGVGLLLPGVVALWFAAQCLLQYQLFTAADAHGEDGLVTAIENVPVAGGTEEQPLVQYKHRDETLTLHGPRASGWSVGDRVRVIETDDASSPLRVAKPSDLRGGAIAMMLFGTFPASLAVFFLSEGFAGGDGSENPGATEPVDAAVSPRRQRLLREYVVALNLLMFAGIVWIGYGSGSLEQRFVTGFGMVALGMFCYAIWGLFAPGTNRRWSLGMLILAINFAVWAFALHLLM